MSKYVLLEDRFEHKAGLIVQHQRHYDYGLANDDTRITGEEHMTVSADGEYPGFTAPTRILKEIADEL